MGVTTGGVCMAGSYLHITSVWESDPVVLTETNETLRHRPEWLGRQTHIDQFVALARALKQ